MYVCMYVCMCCESERVFVSMFECVFLWIAIMF